MFKRPRQGDVYYIKYNGTLEGLREAKEQRGKVTTGYGEETGHRHQVIGDVAWLLGAIKDINGHLDRFANGVLEDGFIKVGPGGARATHDDHEGFPLAEGVYIVRRQREYEPSAINKSRPAFD